MTRNVFRSPAARLAPRLALLGVAAVALAACSGFRDRLDGAYDKGLTTDQPYQKVHPITVESATKLVELPAKGPVAGRDAAALDALARGYLTEGEGPITVAYPAAAGKGGSAAGAVRSAVRRLRAAGVAPRKIVTGAYDPSADGDRGVVVSYAALTATAGACGGLWEDTIQTYANQTPARFGCSHQRNLAAMISNPRDLLGPAPRDPSNPERRAVALEHYVAGSATTSDQTIQNTSTTGSP
ncbi:MAG: CpaD family pilus assembly lipoprotein [Pseudomonadota bacterium]